MSWRNCKASEALVEEINKRWPKRDKTSDGTIGDAEHASRQSDHNPWVKDSKGVGVVRARDIDKDGIEAEWLAEYLRQAGLKGDPRLKNQGYVIFNHRITSPDFKQWNPYTGANAHEHHVHVSFSVNQSGYDSTASWGIYPKVAATPWYRGDLGSRVIKRGSRGDDVGRLQAILVERYPAYAKGLHADGIYGATTETVVREFQRRAGMTVDGVAGRKTFRALGI